MSKFTKDHRLLSKLDFAHMKGARKTYSKGLSAYYKASKVKSKDTRLGISVSRRVSKNATVRNRIKRVIREWFRKSKYRYMSLDILVVAYPSLNVDDIDNQLGIAFRHIPRGKRD